MASGGVEQLTLALARYLGQEGHSSTVISRGGVLVKELAAAGTEHLSWPYMGEKSPRALLHVLPLRRILLQEGVDVLHLHSRLPAWVGLLAWKSLPPEQRPLLVSTFHGFYSINAYSAVMTKGQRLIAVSEVIAEHMVAAYGVVRQDIEVIHPGIEAQAAFNPALVADERQARLLASWGLAAAEEPIILFPARLTRLKGHDVFLKALKEIEGLPWRAVCVGAIDEGSTHTADIRSLIRELGLAERVQLSDNCPDMPAAMALATIVVSASKEPESFGLTAVEGQAMERAVLVTAHGGSLETVQDGETGLHVPPDDAASLAQGLALLLQDAPLRQRLGRAGREHVLANFTVARMCEKTVALYNRSSEEIPQ